MNETGAQRQVYVAINAVSDAMAKVGIAKGRQNQTQGYAFRGIDDVYNTLAPLLAKYGLVIVPRMLARTCTERVSRNGATLFSVIVEAEFDFVASADGSQHTARTFGEAMDSGDKATNKAMSAAYKYAAFQIFCIPTEGDNDADATTHEVEAPSGEYLDWLTGMKAAAARGTESLRQEWRDSPTQFRRTLQDTNRDLLDKLTADAAEHGA